MNRNFIAPAVVSAVCAAMVAIGSAAAVAQERTGRFQRTVDFAPPKTVKLDASVGPVKIESVEFADLGRGYSSGGFGARFRAASDSEASTAVRARFLVDNPTREEWELTLTLEFLDKDGKVVDKLTKKNDYDDETATWNIEHPLLEYVMPLIDQVRITIQGRVS
jgi:hypothetical protein